MPDEHYPDTDAIMRELPFAPHSFDLSESEYESFIEDIREEEIDRIEKWANVSIGIESATETLNGSDGYKDRRDIRLSHRPVTDVQSVTVDGEELDSSEYYATDTHLEHLGSGWPRGRRNVTIEYEHGYEDAPGPFRDGLVRLIRSRIEQRKTDGLESESADSSYTYRPSSEIKHEVRADIEDVEPPGYFGASQVI